MGKLINITRFMAFDIKFTRLGFENACSTSVLEALSGKLDIKRHSPSILYISVNFQKG